jgi:hypothetical protein
MIIQYDKRNLIKELKKAIKPHSKLTEINDEITFNEKSDDSKYEIIK